MHADIRSVSCVRDRGGESRREVTVSLEICTSPQPVAGAFRLDLCLIGDCGRPYYGSASVESGDGALRTAVTMENPEAGPHALYVLLRTGGERYESEPVEIEVPG